MQIDISLDASVTVITISGSMDATTVTAFDAEWKKQLTDGVKKIAVDMTGLDYISSAGLRGILMLAKVSRAKGASLAFFGMKAMVLDMFKLSGFLAILKIYPDRAAALAALQ
ncbi:MAG: STAS domain-containing protein [Duodenibacillus sp.]|nr:STAS domain-containing protein [Duodenibacillus sp.]